MLSLSLVRSRSCCFCSLPPPHYCSSSQFHHFISLTGFSAGSSNTTSTTHVWTPLGGIYPSGTPSRCTLITKSPRWVQSHIFTLFTSSLLIKVTFKLALPLWLEKHPPDKCLDFSVLLALQPWDFHFQPNKSSLERRGNRHLFGLPSIEPLFPFKFIVCLLDNKLSMKD